MERIASFSVDHDALKEGVYFSRSDCGVDTYDIRMKRPNAGDYLSTGTAHTIEHLFATCARNGAYKDSVVYVGPMGCRTGFYLLVSGLDAAQALTLIKESFDFIAAFEGEIPGSKPEECGNCRDHDLAGAKREAAAMAEKLKDLTPEMMKY